MKVSFRKLNSQLAPILLFPLLATAATGIIDGLGNRLFKLPNAISDVLMTIHQGKFLGEKLVPFYVSLMGLGVFAVGLRTFIQSRDSLMSQQPKSNTVGIYKLVAMILVFPLALCVETGVAYSLGKDWLGMSSQQTKILLSIHHGASLGKTLGIFYILITGFSLVALSIAGFEMTPLSKRIFPRKQLAKSSEPKPFKSAISLSDNAALLRKKVQLAILIFSLVFSGILYLATSAILVSIPIVGIAFTIPALIIAEKLIQNWQGHQQKIQATFYEQEAESVTILRAVPDSMLRMSQDGICLSYIPAKQKGSFELTGDILNKHVTEFVAPEIALQWIKSAQLSLQSGLTHVYRFPIPLEHGGMQYHEARISPIGQTEVLIMVREIADFNEPQTEPEQLSQKNDDGLVRFLTEPELIQLLELTLKDSKKDGQHHTLCSLALDNPEIDDNQDSQADDNLLHQMAVKMRSYLSSDFIARLDGDELVVLVPNCSLKETSVFVDELRHSLDGFLFRWQGKEYPISVSISLLEINADSPDAVGLMSAAKATCHIAKRKLKFKTF